MPDKAEPSVEEGKKPSYEPPQIVKLNEIDTARGGIPPADCISGTSAVTGFCDTGGGGRPQT